MTYNFSLLQQRRYQIFFHSDMSLASYAPDVPEKHLVLHINYILLHSEVSPNWNVS